MAILRFGARAVVVDADNRVLLFRLQNPTSGNTWWATPGGGVEKGEKSVDAVRRELLEETGIEAAGFEGPVWIDDHWFRTSDDLVHQQDRYFLVRLDHPEVDVSGMDRFEAGFMLEHRWWPLDELESTDAKVHPIGLAGHLRSLLRDGVPDKPLKLPR